MASPLILDLSANYPATLGAIRSAIDRNRSGFETIRLQAPINYPSIYVAINRKDIYLQALRPEKGTIWYGFSPPKDQKGTPDLFKPEAGTTMTTIHGDSGYTFLGLDVDQVYPDSPGGVLSFLTAIFPPDGSGGQLGDLHRRRSVLALIFLVSEALRFRSIETAMAAWCETFSINFCPYKDIVRNWKTNSGNSDVVLKCLTK